MKFIVRLASSTQVMFVGRWVWAVTAIGPIVIKAEIYAIAFIKQINNTWNRYALISNQSSYLFGWVQSIIPVISIIAMRCSVLYYCCFIVINLISVIDISSRPKLLSCY